MAALLPRQFLKMAAELSSSRQALVEAAKRAEADGEPEIAIARWQEARDKYPNRSEAYREGAACLMRLGQTLEAADLLRDAMQRFPGDDWLAVDYAWAAFELGELEECGQICADLRRRFPDNLGGYLAGALSCRRLSRFDEADTICLKGVARFPDNLQLFLFYAQSAQERGDDAEAAQRWQLVCDRFPDATEGPVGLAAALSKIGRFDDADAMLAEVMARLPHREDLMTAHAWVAHDRQHWPTALRRWEAVISLGKQPRQPRHLAAVALDALGRYGEAAQVLAPALRMFPDDQELAVLNAWLATRRRDTEEARRLWRDVRARFTDIPDGYRGEAAALVDVGRLDEADAVLVEGLKHFADNFELAGDHARIAEYRPNWPLAAGRWREVVARCPDEPAAHIELCNSLLKSGQPEEAQTVVKESLQRFPEDVAVAATEAAVASQRKDWERAIEVWTAIETRFPHDVRGPVGLAHTLRASGQLERAEQSLAEAAQRFSGNVEIEVQLALTLSAGRQWPKALALWASLKERFPQHSQVTWGISHIIDQAVIDQAAAVNEPFEIPPTLAQGPVDQSAEVKSLSKLLNRFESMGDSCEFAMVQRLYNVNNLSLLRWASTPPDMLLAALDLDLAGVGDPQNTIIAVSGDEYTTEDTRYYMHSHTFTAPAAEPLESFGPEQCRRIQWLRGRFLLGLKAAAKIWVYTYRGGITDPQQTELYGAVCRYNPDNVLLCVKLQTPEHPLGSVEEIQAGLFVGYLDRFSTIDISVDGWLTLCRQVAARLPAPTATKAAS
jgi:tetratricopeptide (TPR) repeat protein